MQDPALIRLTFHDGSIRPSLSSFADCRQVPKGNRSIIEDARIIRSLNRHYVIFSNFSKSLFITGKAAYDNAGSSVPRAFIDSGLVTEKRYPRKGFTEFFDTLYLSLSNRCNLRCTYCYVEGGKTDRTAGWSAIKAAIDYISSLRNRKQGIHFLGEGETTLNPELLEKTVSYARAKIPGARFTISTNGVMGPQARAFLLQHMTEIKISMDGPPELQDTQRPFADGSPSSGIVGETIHFFQEHKKQVTIKLVVTTETLGKELAICRYLSSLGVRRISLSRQDSLGRGLHKRSPTMQEFTGFMLAMDEICANMGIEIDHGPAHGIGSAHAMGCGAGINNFSLSSSSDISGCFSIPSQEDIACLTGAGEAAAGVISNFVFGKISDGKVILDQARLQTLRGMTNLDSSCRSCRYEYLCGGGCPLKNALATGSLTKPDAHICEGTIHMYDSILTYAAELGYFRRYPYLGDRSLYLQHACLEIEKVAVGSSPVKLPVDRPCLIIPSPDPVRRMEFSRNFAGQLAGSRAKGGFCIVSRALPRCFFAGRDYEQAIEHGMPASCRECPEMFTVEDGKVIFCGGRAGRDLSCYDSREEIWREFSRQNMYREECSFCPYRYRDCSGFCSKVP